MARLIKYIQYVPAIWAAIKIMWTLYKTKVKADGYREALKDEQRKRVAAEAKLAIGDRLSGDDPERMSRVRREAAARDKSRK